MMRQIAKFFSLAGRSVGLSLALVAIILIPSDGLDEGADRHRPSPVRIALNSGSIAAIDPSDLAPGDTIDVDDPLAANAAIPYAKAPLQTAFGVNLLSARYDEMSQSNALECLTAAIYYEAGYEPPQGQRAVAQVVLNRVRHPLYPNSVCNVVYQGSQRRTGCQFTFTCDGSLARRPAPNAWNNAKTVASNALSGGVEPSVGMATHYHANYVLPYWAPSLDKIVTIGSHIFYKWKGTLGQRSAFSQLPTSEPRHFTSAIPDSAGFGQVPEPPVATVVPQPFEEDRIDLLTGPARAVPDANIIYGPSLTIEPNLGSVLADEQTGTLIIDER